MSRPAGLAAKPSAVSTTTAAISRFRRGSLSTPPDARQTPRAIRSGAKTSLQPVTGALQLLARFLDGRRRIGKADPDIRRQSEIFAGKAHDIALFEKIVGKIGIGANCFTIG